MTVQTPKLDSPTLSRQEEGRRNTFLDAVRAIAILRVIIWHTYGYAWLSYLVASMPAMFFVAGSLMALSLQRGKALDVLLRRLRRLLIPLWVIAAVALTAMMAYESVSPLPASQFDERGVVWWLFPIWDPSGSSWGLTWWAPLWYLRCITWLLLASPLLMWLWQRFGLAVLVVPLVGLAFMEERLRAGAAAPWQLQDVALYSVFWMLGFAYTEGRLARLSRPTRAAICLVCASVAAVWALTQDIPSGVVNASYPLHLFVGLAWLFGALTLEETISRFAIRERVATAVYWVNERALTIYLWHVAGLFAMYQVLWTEQHSRLERVALALPIVVSVTFLAVLLFGWVEDVAAKRRPRLWLTNVNVNRPRRRVAVAGIGLVAGATVIGGLVALLITVSNMASEPSAVAKTDFHSVPPSGVGLRLQNQLARIVTVMPTQSISGRSEPVTAEELQNELEVWLRHWRFSGATVSLQRPSGEAWTGSAGEHADGSPFLSQEHYEIGSLTKTFTVALVLRLAERGLIDLDSQVSTFVPNFPEAERFTVRNLIQHTSGLIAGDVRPFDALAQAAEAGLQFEPGTSFLYSRAGYYLLALIIEEVLGKSYTEALHEELIDPLGLSSTLMDEEINPLPYSTHPYRANTSGYEGVIWTSGGLHREILPDVDYHGILWSSGGLWSTTSDLARWAAALWGSEQVVSASTLDAMTTFLGKEFEYTGLGTYPFCPCWLEGERLRAERWGHLGSTALEYDPVDQIAIAINTSESIQDGYVLLALDNLSARLRLLVRGRLMTMELTAE